MVKRISLILVVGAVFSAIAYADSVSNSSYGFGNSAQNACYDAEISAQQVSCGSGTIASGPTCSDSASETSTPGYYQCEAICTVECNSSN